MLIAYAGKLWKLVGTLGWTNRIRIISIGTSYEPVEEVIVGLEEVRVEAVLEDLAPRFGIPLDTEDVYVAGVE